MRTLKIFILIFILPITLFAQDYSFRQNQLPINHLIKPLMKNNVKTIQRMDSIISNSVTGGKFKMIFEYDNNDNITVQLKGGWITGFGWWFIQKSEYFYNENNKLVLRLNLELTGTSWDSVSRFDYFYNTQNQLSQYIYQNYISNEWENYQRETYEYDVYGNEVNNLTEVWENGWQNFYFFTRYFSNINRMDSSFYQIWNLIEWENYGLEPVGKMMCTE